MYFTLVFGRLFLKRFALCYRTVVLSVLSVLSGCNVYVLWPNGLMDQDDVGLGPGHIVLDGDPVPTHGKGHSSPQLSKFTGAGFVAGTGSKSVR